MGWRGGCRVRVRACGHSHEIFVLVSLRVRGGACLEDSYCPGQSMVDPSLSAAPSSTTTTTCVACCVVHEGGVALTRASTPWLGGEEEYCKSVVSNNRKASLARPPRTLTLSNLGSNFGRLPRLATTLEVGGRITCSGDFCLCCVFIVLRKFKAKGGGW